MSGPIVRQFPYGSDPSQFVRLHLPDEGSALPVVVVVHGGFWRTRYGVELADPLCADLIGHGVAAAAVEYRRVGPDGSGGWPATLLDVATAVDDISAAGQYLARGRLDTGRMAVVGHSAGGHLATWLAHRASVRPTRPGAIRPGDWHQPVRGVVAQAGLLDLVAASRQRLGAGGVDDFLGGGAGSVAQRYTHASPINYVGDGARVVCVHGDADDTVPLNQSQEYVAAAVAAGDPAELVVLPGVGHMELIDPAGPAWAVARERALALLADQ